MSDSAFHLYVQATAGLLAQARVRAKQGACLTPAEIEACTLEAALLYAQTRQRKVFSEQEALEALQALAPRIQAQLCSDRLGETIPVAQGGDPTHRM